MFEAAEDEKTVQQLVNKSMTMYDQVISAFTTDHQHSMAAWVMLKKAALMGKHAALVNPIKQPEIAQQALQTIKNGLDAIEAHPPPNLKVTIQLYLALIETLLIIRAVYNNSDRNEALDELINATSAHLGTLLAQDLSIRSQAHDQLFTAQVLESLLENETNPQACQELIEKSQSLARQAYNKLRVSTATDLAPAVSLLEALANRCIQADPPIRIHCPGCETEIPTEALLCSQCGTRLIQEAQ